MQSSACACQKSGNRKKYIITAAVKRSLLACLRLYKRQVSPALSMGSCQCKYLPTCSEYAYEAIEHFGVFRGLLLAFWRLLRCNPFSKGGYDPVPEVFLHR